MHSLWEWGWSENIKKSRKCGKKLVLLILWPPVLPCDTQALEGNITRSVLRFGLPLRQLPDHPGYYGAVTTHRANVPDVPNVYLLGFSSIVHVQCCHAPPFTTRVVRVNFQTKFSTRSFSLIHSVVRVAASNTGEICTIETNAIINTLSHVVATARGFRDLEARQTRLRYEAVHIQKSSKQTPDNF